jgi:hypothetical protein
VLEHVGELAESILSEGVLMPLSVILRGAEYVVLDGHCRAMACVIAKVPEVPVRLETDQASGDEADLANATHRFLLNWTQQRLSPLEAARQVERIVEIASRVVQVRITSDSSAESDVTERDGTPDTALVEETWVAEAGVAIAPAARLQRGQTRAQEMDAAVRRLVLARTGLPLSQYHVLRQIGNLSPDAWDLADGLSEAHLRAVVTAPRNLHALLAQLVKAANASVKETRAYCRAAKEQGEEFIQKKLDELVRRREEPLRQRTAVSWEPLLRALPEDLTPRISSLRAELAALEESRRAVRLRTISRQLRLLNELRHAYEEVLLQFGTPPDGACPE